MSIINDPLAKAVERFEAISKLKPLPTTVLLNGTQITASSETVKYKASNRYSFGYTDPRGVWGASSFPITGFKEAKQHLEIKPHYAQQMTDEQIRAAWLLLFGSDPIAYTRIGADGDEDNWNIAYEAFVRGLVHEEFSHNAFAHFYKLKNNGNS